MRLPDVPQIDFLKKKGSEIEFEILALETLFARQQRINNPLDAPHRVHFHNIIYITEGSGTHHIDFEPYNFSPGSLLFISQGQVHSFDTHPDTKGHLLLFTRNYLEKNLIHSDIVSLYRLYNYHLHSPVMQPQETQGEEFHHLFEQIRKEYDNPDQFAKEEILRLLLKILLLKAERIKQTLTTDLKKTEWLIKFGHFKEHLDEQITTTRSVKDYAEMLNISSKHLNTICKAITGGTAKQFIDNFMTLEIKRLLATSTDSIQEISFDFGMEEPTNFVKYFKKHCGQSPSQFRKTFTD